MFVRDSPILKTWKVFATFGVTIGLLLVCLSLYYLWLYFVEIKNAYRHEYLAGMAMALMFSFPFWLLASFSMYKNKSKVPKFVYVPTIILTIVVSLFLIAGVASPLYLS